MVEYSLQRNFERHTRRPGPHLIIYSGNIKWSLQFDSKVLKGVWDLRRGHTSTARSARCRIGKALGLVLCKGGGLGDPALPTHDRIIEV